MSTPPPTGPVLPSPEGGTEQPTADLSELAATDALLDRLAARRPDGQDLQDPTAAALNALLADIDADAGADPGAARLVEVLAGRPLYIDGPSPVPAEEDLIDLTEPGRPVVPIGAARSRRWKVAAGKVSVPVAAASVAVLVILGGGVSAAVAGDPMAPLNGVSSVVNKLPGVDSSGRSLKRAQNELQMAEQMAASDPATAAQHLANAQKALGDVPDKEKARLTARIGVVASRLPGTPTATATPVLSTATPTVPATTAGSTTAPTGAPTGTPSASATTTPPASATTTPSASPGTGSPSTTSSPTQTSAGPGSPSTTPSTQSSSPVATTAAPSTPTSAQASPDGSPSAG